MRNGIAPGAQTKRPGVARPVRRLRDGTASPAAFSSMPFCVFARGLKINSRKERKQKTMCTT
jgi:hypothetical protein